LPAIKQRIESEDPKQLLDPIKALSSEFGAVDGASKIKSAVSKARSILRKKNPDTEAALESIDKAIALFDEEIAWRDQAMSTIAAPLAEYEEQMRGSIGIRQQDKMTREQALSVASCNAEHKDISLNF